MKIIFDMDDQSDKYNALPWLLEMKKKIPQLKVSLFTIPRITSTKLLHQMVQHDWIELIPHGLYHDTNWEWAETPYETAFHKLMCIPQGIFYQRGFKAPGWQLSLGTMQALKDLGFWLAVQFKNGHANPNIKYQPPVMEGLKYYAINELKPGYQSIHGHTWEVCNNGPKDLEPILEKLPADVEFEFISDYVKQTN